MHDRDPQLARYLTNPALWDRRTFLKAAAVAAQWPFLNLPVASAADRKARLGDNPFTLGVASGEPTADGVALWTRLAPRPTEGGGMPKEDVQVRWMVAEDDRMTRVVQKGTATAAHDWAHSVHVEVSGLRPDRVYYYQFVAGSEESPIGRTRTAPAADAMLDRFRFAFASCQHWEAGLYTAYEHMQNEDLNLVVHLGDYIYEAAGKEGRVRKHVGPVLRTLDDYRNRHAQYKTDPALQAAHAAFPWAVAWDDHEVRNNYAGDVPERLNADPVKFLQRRAAAYKAYYEHMPLRRKAVPQGPLMSLYRTLEFGRLARFNILDTRQYRTDQPCGDKLQSPCEGMHDPNATMLGKEQEEWLCQGLKQSTGRWNILAQQVIMARIDRQPGEERMHPMDAWAGYDVPRTRLLKFLDDHQISNPVVLTGDIHKNWVNDLKLDFDRPESKTVATELVGTSISSAGDGPAEMPDHASTLAENPFVKFYNGQRGYVRCTLTPERWTTDFQTIDYVTRPGAPLTTKATFEIETGRAGANQVS